MAIDRWITDTSPSARFPVYTRMNANDVLPDPITPLGATLVWIPQILPGWADGYVLLNAFTRSELDGDEYPPVAGFFYGHLYINQSTVRIIGIRAGIGWQAIDSAFFNSPGAPPHQESPGDVNAAVSERMAARTTWALTAETFPELDEDRMLADSCRAQRPDLASLTSAALVVRARSVLPIERLMWRGETIGSNQAAIGPGVIAQLVGDAEPSLAVKLIAGAGDVDSAAPSYALWDLSRHIRSDQVLSEEFDRGLEGLHGRLPDTCPDFAGRFQGFLREYGYRGPAEWDIGSDSWETRPELVLALLDRLRHVEDGLSPAARRGEVLAEAEAAMRKALEIIGDNAEARQMLDMAVASARRFAAWRERGKANCIKVLHEARVALLELGRRLHADGHLSHPGQIFMALDTELDILVSEPATLGDTLEVREQEWKTLSDLDLPTFVDGAKPVPPLSELPRRAEAQAVAVATPGETLSGAPASAGVVRGRARVVLDPAHLSDFQPGEILIAPQTDPSWTPLFMVAGGVVVDVGALASHAMIVSRELGIPCAAGVADATRRIPDGSLVEVDGSTGRVTVLDI